MLGCGCLQLGREGIRELLRVISCNSLPLSLVVSVDSGGGLLSTPTSYHTWWQL